MGWTKVLRAALALDVNGQPALAFCSVPNGGIYVAMKPLLNEKLFLPFVGR